MIVARREGGSGTRSDHSTKHVSTCLHSSIINYYYYDLLQPKYNAMQCKKERPGLPRSSSLVGDMSVLCSLPLIYCERMYFRSVVCHPIYYLYISSRTSFAMSSECQPPTHKEYHEEVDWFCRIALQEST